MIKLKKLTKNYGKLVAVDALDLEVPAGQLFGFLGPNGAGKTTTIRMMAGLLKPTAGEIFIDGVSVLQEPAKAKQVCGFIPDRPFVYSKLTGREDDGDPECGYYGNGVLAIYAELNYPQDVHVHQTVTLEKVTEVY